MVTNHRRLCAGCFFFFWHQPAGIIIPWKLSGMSMVYDRLLVMYYRKADIARRTFSLKMANLYKLNNWFLNWVWNCVSPFVYNRCRLIYGWFYFFSLFFRPKASSFDDSDFVRCRFLNGFQGRRNVDIHYFVGSHSSTWSYVGCKMRFKNCELRRYIWIYAYI